MREIRRFSLALALAWSVVLMPNFAWAAEMEGEVRRVTDGDTLVVTVKGQRVRVRLLEIDAPESKQAFGKVSRDSLASLCAGKRARVSWQRKDQYGRTLGRVWCNGIDANAEQIRRGMAWVFDRYVTDRSLYPLQDSARAARLGLWSDNSPVAPWDWRRAKNQNEVGKQRQKAR